MKREPDHYNDDGSVCCWRYKDIGYCISGPVREASTAYRATSNATGTGTSLSGTTTGSAPAGYRFVPSQIKGTQFRILYQCANLFPKFHA